MSKAPIRCWRCKGSVIWLPLGGVPIAIEACDAGTGDLALQRQLDGSEIALTATGTRWRRHSAGCSVPSYVATAPAPKVRL